MLIYYVLYKCQPKKWKEIQKKILTSSVFALVIYWGWKKAYLESKKEL